MPKTKSKETLESQLLNAAMGGDTKKVAQLLKLGARVDCSDSYGTEAPLKLALRNHHKEVVALLLDNGANKQEYQREEKILQGLKDFLKKGTISDEILIFFDQTGVFQNIQLPWSKRNQENEEFLEDCAKKLSQVKISKQRITFKDPKGAFHLRTSYSTEHIATPPQKGPPLEIPYATIAGNCDISENIAVNAKELTHIGGKLTTSYSRALGPGHINFPELQEIGGGFTSPNARVLIFPKLKRIKGALSIQAAEYCNFQELERIEGCLHFNGEEFLAPKLGFIGAKLCCQKAKVFKAEKLREICGSITIDDLRGASTPSLYLIGGDIMANRTSPKSLRKFLKNLSVGTLERLCQEGESHYTAQSLRVSTAAKATLKLRKEVEELKGAGLELG